MFMRQAGCSEAEIIRVDSELTKANDQFLSCIRLKAADCLGKITSCFAFLAGSDDGFSSMIMSGFTYISINMLTNFCMHALERKLEKEIGGVVPMLFLQSISDTQAQRPTLTNRDAILESLERISQLIPTYSNKSVTSIHGASLIGSMLGAYLAAEGDYNACIKLASPFLLSFLGARGANYLLSDAVVESSSRAGWITMPCL
jgi:hypothetical protein